MSIDAKELRIGNWVETYMVMVSGSWYDKDGEQHGQDVVTEPTINRRQIIADDLKIIMEAKGLATYRPIPITPELLLKCGFEKIEYGLRIQRVEYQLLVDPCGIVAYAESLINKPEWYFANTSDDFYQFPLELKYLHQLQNLIFALTNTELEINLTIEK